ncbi:MAG: FKBP-type peptidyl-prolyl cis-trans isomerase [Bacteroidetes bacterium]|nr:FKBP-type peptidyl-prolyl cis-trans isomerase [Bacteroidota bacterium]
MKKHFLLLVAAAAFFVSCKKSSGSSCPYTESSFVAPASEQATLQAYINANHPGAIQHSSGLYYEITTPGSGTVTPGVCSTVLVQYIGKLTDGTVFDSNTTGVSFTLGQLILGWQKGIPLIKKGGIITLYLPPSLGYGANQVGSIPANSILIFNIQLMDVL